MSVGLAPSALAARREQRSPRRRRLRLLWRLAAVAVFALLGLTVTVLFWSGAELATDPAALARVETQPLAGSLESARAFGPDGSRIPLAVRGGRLVPRVKLDAGEEVSIDVVIRRPGWLGWAIGKDRLERLTVRTPVAQVRERWLTVPAGSPIRLTFDRPVSAVGYEIAGHLVRRELPGARRSVLVDRRAVTGSFEVAAAARSWERLGAPFRVSWFPPAAVPIAIVSPTPDTHIAPLTPIRLTFSKPVADVLGSKLPKLSPRTPGQWHLADSHTLVFDPTGLGAPLNVELSLTLPRPVAIDARAAHSPRTTRQLHWTVPGASILRLQQLLAQAGYLPVDWTPAGAPVAATRRAELGAAIEPPSGHFDWRYPDIPPELRSLWTPGQPNQITRGAVMMLESDNGLTVDGFAGPKVWSTLIADAIAGKRREAGYSYVYVHRRVPQSLNLWHNGATILSSPGNTGVPAAPTQLGTFPVFEHIPIGTMRGRNPDGTRYDDPGIRYISFFHGGDAIHAFNRASFGTPQSLGCVELPLASAQQVWPYTPIGTLVTIEN